MLPEADTGGHRRHLVMALVANASSAAVKLAAFAVTGASVLLSEGLHSIADCGNQAALMLGHRRAAAAPSAIHPLGRGRARYLWAFVVAVVVFGGGAVGSFAEATHRLLNPGEHPRIGLTLAALVVTGVIEGMSFWSLVRAASVTRRAGEPWVGFISRSRDPDLPVLLVEDVSDLVGLGLALIGTLVSDLTGIGVLDVVASYLIAGLLACNAVFLGREMASLVLGEAPEPGVEQAVLVAVNSGRGSWPATQVEAVHLGPDELLVMVAVDGGPDEADADPLSRLREARRRAIAASGLSARVVFDVNPDLRRLPHPDPDPDTEPVDPDPEPTGPEPDRADSREPDARGDAGP